MYYVLDLTSHEKRRHCDGARKMFLVKGGIYFLKNKNISNKENINGEEICS